MAIVQLTWQKSLRGIQASTFQRAFKGWMGLTPTPTARRTTDRPRTQRWLTEGLKMSFPANHLDLIGDW
jgi:hypothetical protein